MEKNWILIANGERARCFDRAPDHSLTELTDFVFPRASLSGQAGGGDLTQFTGPELKKRVDQALTPPSR